MRVLRAGGRALADLVLPRAQARTHERILAGSRRPVVPVVPAVLGERAGAMGVALLAGDLVSGA